MGTTAISSFCVPVRIVYEGLHCDPRLSIAIWYETTGRGPAGYGVRGTITVVTAAIGTPFVSVERKRSCHALTGRGTPSPVIVTGRERRIAPGGCVSSPAGGE